jgi:hypothetical protein
MNPRWHVGDSPDGASRREILVHDVADWRLFEALASELKEALGGEWASKLDGPDQRYWDLQTKSGTLTLHLEHYLGISVFVKDDGRSDVRSADLLEATFSVLQRLDPGRNRHT